MKTQTLPGSMVFPNDGRKTDIKAQPYSVSFDQAKKKKILLTLTVWIWILAVIAFSAFYVAVRSNRPGTDLLAGICLGMVILGWIIVARCFKLANKQVQRTEKGRRYEK
jgi:lipopolysaccharide export LptBFGC system permease protein LptF